jgi:hypothetical protein
MSFGAKYLNSVDLNLVQDSTITGTRFGYWIRTSLDRVLRISNEYLSRNILFINLSIIIIKLSSITHEFFVVF